MTRVLKALVLIGIVAGLLLVPLAEAATFRVKTTANDRWNPSFKHITPGNRIAWKNPARHDDVHDLKAYGGNWHKEERLSPGETTRKRFRRTGTFRYRCVLHSNMNNGNCSGMCGIIHVAN